jgi:N-acetylneuraminic acid mutarotase
VKNTLRKLQFLAALGCLVVGQAQVPQLINFQGRIAVEGVNFTGEGRFKFALVNGDASAAFWSNDAASSAGSEPAAAVIVPVQHGLYSVLLGDATLTNMLPIPSTVFTNDDVRLRVWFSDGTNGFQQLTPDQRIAAVGYAMMAANVIDGSITSSKLAPNAVTASSIAAGSIGTAQLAPNAAAENLRAGGQSGVASGGIILSDETNSTNLTQAGYVRIGQVSLDTEEWQRRPRNQVPPTRIKHTAVWTGTEVILWGGFVRRPGAIQSVENTGVRFNPQTGQWRELSTNNAPTARADHTAVWTGTEMIVWGGAPGSGGSRYHPATDTWRPVAAQGAPTARSQHTAVWAGQEMIVWGGYAGSTSQPLNDGARYDRATDRWTPISSVGAPAARSQHTAVWAGTEMIVWGGYSSGDLADGGRYFPEQDSWMAMSAVGAPSARVAHTAIWTGGDLVILGGATSNGVLANNFGRYRPSADSWTTLINPAELGERKRHTTVWTGSSAITWGGIGPTGVALNSGAIFTPATESWRAMPTTGAPAPSEGPTAVWAANEMIAFGGTTSSFGRFVLATQQWAPLGAAYTTVAGRRGHTAVWTGSEWLVWGGVSGSAVLNTGFHYNPATDRLTEMPIESAPTPRTRHSAVWTGQAMMVWGGNSSADSRYGRLLNDGGQYDPLTKRWTSVPAKPTTPTGRYDHTAVWTGTEMIVWGGHDAVGVLDTGARFLPSYGSPSSNVWVAMPTSGAPDARAGHTAIWTGTEMVVWGGYSIYGPSPYRSTTNLNTGGHYSPIEDEWVRTTPVRGAPSARQRHRAVWTGAEMIVWGGSTYQGSLAVPPPTLSSRTNLPTGARYNPITEAWSPMNTNGLPDFLAYTSSASGPPDAVPTAVWTGSEMLVWGMASVRGTNVSAGASYHLAGDSWTSLSDVGAPGPRGGQTAVWTGSGMLVFGGVSSGVPSASSYDPTVYYYVRSKPMYLYQRP